MESTNNLKNELIKLAIPNIISNFTVPLLGMADLFLMGRMDSVSYIGAIGLGSMIFNFIYWGFGFLRMSTGGFTAQAFGRKDNSEITALLIRSLMIALLASIFLLIIQVPIAKLSFLLIKGQDEVEFLASQYFYIRIWAAPATIGIYAFTGWFIGMQNAKIPMYTALIINGLNIGLNFFFVYALHMKSDGVAYGTVIAQYVGLLSYFIFFYKKYRRYLTYYSKQLAFKFSEYFKFFNVSKDIFFRTMMLVFVISFIQIESARLNSTILAVNNVLLQFFTLFSFFADGLAHAGEAVAGKYFGSKEKSLFKQSIIQTFKLGLLITIVFTLLYIMFNDYLLKIFTDIPEIIEGAKTYIIWVIVIPLISFVAFLWDGIFIGITESKGLRNSMFIATIIFFSTFFLTRNQFANNGLWFSFIVFLTVRGIVQSIIYRFYILKRI